jgi:hypothetical protein
MKITLDHKDEIESAIRIALLKRGYTDIEPARRVTRLQWYVTRWYAIDPDGEHHSVYIDYNFCMDLPIDEAKKEAYSMFLYAVSIEDEDIPFSGWYLASHSSIEERLIAFMRLYK